MKSHLNFLITTFQELEVNKDIEAFIVKLKGYFGDANKKLTDFLIEAANGDNRNLNDYIFSMKPEIGQVIPWIGKVKTTTESKFAWLVGLIDYESQSKVRDLIDNAWSKIKLDKLFSSTYSKPPYITYIRSIACSQWQINQDVDSANSVVKFGRVGMFVESTALPHNKPLTPEHCQTENLSSDIEIFQSNFSNSNVTEDVEWKMPLSADFLSYKTAQIFERVKLYFTDEVIDFYEKNVLEKESIITKLHTELHNHGHFLGPYPYSQESKNIEEYEAIEEYRACLITSAVSHHLEINEQVYYGLPLHVFMMRYIGYGLDYFLTGNTDIVSVREMEVGVLFYNLLEQHGALKHVGSKIHIDIPALPDIYKKEIERIHQLESNIKEQNKIQLLEIAGIIKQNLYNGQRKNIQAFYENLG